MVKIIDEVFNESNVMFILDNVVKAYQSSDMVILGNITNVINQSFTKEELSTLVMIVEDTILFDDEEKQSLIKKIKGFKGE